MKTKHDPYVMRECVKAYLLDVRSRQTECRELEMRIIETRERMDGMAGAADGASAPGSSEDPSWRLAKGLAALEELEADWSALVASDADYIARAMEICSPRFPARWACWLHWVERLTWAQVGMRIGYSEDHVKKDVCGVGVSELYPLIPEEYRRYTFPSSF